jgi:hypothetical protein
MIVVLKTEIIAHGRFLFLILDQIKEVRGCCQVQMRYKISKMKRKNNREVRSLGIFLIKMNNYKINN